MQLKLPRICLRQILSFNPSVEGQPLQRNIKMLNPIDVRCFNPSVEGQPLLCNLFNAHPLEAVEYDVSIPLSRDSLCNRVVAEALGTNGYNRLFF